MRNNNSAIIRKITWRSMAADRKRNFFVIAAITLTTILLAVAFSIGISMLESLKLQKIRMTASIAHAYVQNPDNSQLEKMRQLDYIDKVGTGIAVGSVRDRQAVGNIGLTVIYVDSVQWEEINSPAFADITGSYPEAENEIMLSKWTLDHMGITSPELGMEIVLPYVAENDSASVERKEPFVLSGYFTNYYYANSGGDDYALVSEALANKYGCTAEQRGTANIVFKNNNVSYCERLKEDIELHEGQQIITSDISIDANSYFSTFAVLLFLSLIFMAGGYLLIYNTMLISLSKDIRYYGLLKTIGMAPHQIRRIVLYTVMILCCVGIPLGLVTAALISGMIVPGVISTNGIFTGNVVSHSPIIYLGAAAFAIATAFTAAFAPARKAAGVSPVEGSRYTENIMKTVRIRAVDRMSKPVSMVFRNIFRGGKRCAVVLAGMSLSIIILIITSMFVSSIDIDKYAESMLDCDMRLENSARYIHIGTKVFGPEWFESIQALHGVEKVRIITEATCIPSHDGEPFFESGLVTSLFGIDKADVLELNETLDLEIDAEAFDRGEFLILEALSPEQWQHVRQIGGELTGGVSELGRTFELPMGAVIPSGSFTGLAAEILLFVSNNYLYSIADELQIRRIDLDFEQDRDTEAFFVLRELARADNNIALSSRYELKQSVKESVTVLSVLGGSVSLVFGIIGILNYINVMAVGVISRRRELAILESVGMERRQTGKMLLLEGVGYAVMSQVIGNVFGNVIAAVLYTRTFEQTEYMSFHYPLILLGTFFGVILLICVATPLIVYRSINSENVSERLRQME